jgi:hypothetical protein
MYGWIKPRISVPVHGERRHMEEHARLAKSWGVPEAIVPVNGAAIRLAPGSPQVLSHEVHGRLVLDGDRVIHEERMFEGLQARIRDVRQGPDGLRGCAKASKSVALEIRAKAAPGNPDPDTNPTNPPRAASFGSPAGDVAGKP